MTGGFEAERRVALEAGRAAAQLCRRVQEEMSQADSITKDDRSPVTVADFGSQAVVCRLLKEAFPNDPVIGEENADVLRADDGAPLRERVISQVRQEIPDATEEDVLGWIDRGAAEGGKGRFWALDPIDGTKGFLRGGQYAVALGLVVDGVVQVAVMACPNLAEQLNAESQPGTLFVAVRGQGAYAVAEQGDAEQRIQASPRTDSTQARVVESVEAAHGNHGAHDAIKAHLGIAVESVRLDSQAKYGVLARGEAEVYLRMPTRADYREKIWDQAAGTLVIEEAGGTVTDMHGKPLDFTTGRKLLNNQGVVASNGVLHQQVLQAIAETQGSA